MSVHSTRVSKVHGRERDTYGSEITWELAENRGTRSWRTLDARVDKGIDLSILARADEVEGTCSSGIAMLLMAEAHTQEEVGKELTTFESTSHPDLPGTTAHYRIIHTNSSNFAADLSLARCQHP